MFFFLTAQGEYSIHGLSYDEFDNMPINRQERLIKLMQERLEWVENKRAEEEAKLNNK